jgi:hypothetical protein
VAISWNYLAIIAINAAVLLILGGLVMLRRSTSKGYLVAQSTD